MAAGDAEAVTGASSAPILAFSTRGDVTETVQRGHIVVVGGDGEVRAATGDPEVLTTLRSCAKPLQALPFVELALDALGATAAELALACASHNGEDEHVGTARSLLARAGVGEDELACGPQMPTDEASARRLLAGGGAPLPVHNNCSGKHAAMLATCAVAGWPRAGYVERGHPLQQAVTDTLSTCLGIGLGSSAWGIDGCGLPTFGVPLRALARGFAWAQGVHPLFGRCQDAMAAHPFLVAGTGRFDTALLAASGDRVTAKIGGAGVWVAVVRPAGPAVAIKLEAGSGEAIPPVAIAALQRLGALPDPLPASLEAFAAPVLRNWAGTPIGRIRPASAAL
ncbi:MAG TPA: asparaginase [Candidatus Dormibacteraeota bacterium]